MYSKKIPILAVALLGLLFSKASLSYIRVKCEKSIPRIKNQKKEGLEIKCSSAKRTILYQYWKKGKLHGKYYSWNPKEDTFHVGWYKKGKKHGLFSTYKRYKLLRRGAFVNGKKCGVHVDRTYSKKKKHTYRYCYSLEKRVLHFLQTAELSSISKMTLFHLQPELYRPTIIPEHRKYNLFYNWKITRSVTTTSTKNIKRTLDELFIASLSTQGLSFDFEPRYGIRFATSLRKVDIVLSLDSHKALVIENSSKRKYLQVAPSLKSLLDKLIQTSR